MTDKRKCPDGGTCHHECKPEDCLRVTVASPLSGVYPNDEWPEEVWKKFAWEIPAPEPSADDMLEDCFEVIRGIVQEANDRADRFGHIEVTIRVNALRHGATEEQVEAFVSGEESFVDWMVKVLEGGGNG